MVFLFGANLPDQKLARIALKNIFGIGKYKCEQICNKVSIHPKARMSDLKEDQISRISKLIESDPDKVGHELQRKIAARIHHYFNIKSLRGIRLAHGLPVHGQQTKTNARTCRKRLGQFTGRLKE